MKVFSVLQCLTIGFIFCFHTGFTPPAAWAVRKPRVRSISLLRPDTGRVIRRYRRLRKRVPIKLSKIPTETVLIRANVAPRRLYKQALIEIQSLDSATSTQVLGEGINAKTKEWSITNGRFTIFALPYDWEQGGLGKRYQITVSVVDDRNPSYDLPPAPTPPQASPSPVPSLIPVPQPQPTSGKTHWSVDRGIVSRNGQAVFPLGLYYVSHYGHTKDKRLNDLKKIAAGGFNMLHTPIDRNDGDLMDLCAELGLSVVMEFNDSPEYLVETFGDHPALAMFGTFDDVDAYDNGVPRHLPEKVRRETNTYKVLAPNKMVYISAGFPSRVHNYIGTSDVMGFQSYPIPYESLAAVTERYFTPLASSIAGTNQALLGNLQSFAWYGGGRFPTNKEFRNMTYQAVLGGVKGILYYTFYDSGTDLNDHPALWSEMVKTATELKIMEPWLLYGEQRSLPVNSSQVFAGQWSYDGSTMVVVVNTGNSPQTVSIQLPESFSATTNLFPGRASGLTVNAGYLQGSIGAQDVGIYARAG